MSQIVTLTLNPSLDKSTKVERLIPNEKLRCDEPQHDPGGGGLNVSRVLAELGCPSTAFYTCGGPSGQLLSETLKAYERIQVQATAISGWTRDNLLVIESSTGNQFRFGMPGPEILEAERNGLMDALLSHLSGAEYLVASGSLPKGVPQHFYRDLSRECQKSGTKLVLDTSGEALQEALKEPCFLLKPNLRELRLLTGKDLLHEDEQEAAADDLVKNGVCANVVLSLSSAGAYLVNAKQKLRLRSPTVQMISKVGAGDSMVGGIVCGLIRKWDIADAVRLGIACGAATVSSPGTQLCKKEVVEKLYQRLVDSNN